MARKKSNPLRCKRPVDEDDAVHGASPVPRKKIASLCKSHPRRDFDLVSNSLSTDDNNTLLFILDTPVTLSHPGAYVKSVCGTLFEDPSYAISLKICIQNTYDEAATKTDEVLAVVRFYPSYAKLCCEHFFALDEDVQDKLN